ncbi:MAG: hypothetical protein LBU15_04560 [Rickettsiales bacterium]|jgi:hypothetical protein|nr:hypothetical protein [Rickettsiales bacterium]
MEEILSENKGPEGKNIQELACRSIVSAITSAKSTPAEKMRVFEILLRLFGEWDSSKIEHRGEVIAGAGREG